MDGQRGRERLRRRAAPNAVAERNAQRRVTRCILADMFTTIRVHDKVRDRLKEQAAQSGLTIADHVANLAKAEEQRRDSAADRPG